MKPSPGRARGGGWVAVQMLLIAAVAVTAPRFRGRRARALLPVGGALFSYAAWTGLAGVRDLGRNLTPLPVPREEGELVTKGIFARIRHPLYASVMAMSFGWAFVWGSRLALAPAALLALFLHTKARHEERLLGARFPTYREYAARVPRYLPRAFRGGSKDA